MGWHETAQICMNGHVISNEINNEPEHNQPYCAICGTPTITQCPNCGKRIKGVYRFETLNYYDMPYTATGEFQFPRYCIECGTRYPWTDQIIKAAEELIDLSDIQDTEKQSIKTDLPALIIDTPRTKVAATRTTVFMRKASQEIASGLKSVLIDVVSETAKKMLFPEQ